MMYIWQEEYMCTKCSRVKYWCSVKEIADHDDKAWHQAESLKKKCGWCIHEEVPTNSDYKAHHMQHHLTAFQDVDRSFICFYDLNTCKDKFNTFENLMRHYKRHFGYMKGHTLQRFRMLGLHCELIPLVLDGPRDFGDYGPLAKKVAEMTDRGAREPPDSDLSVFY